MRWAPSIPGELIPRAGVWLELKTDENDFSQMVRNRTRLRMSVLPRETLQNFYSVTSGRPDFFTQPRPISTAAVACGRGRFRGRCGSDWSASYLFWDRSALPHLACQNETVKTEQGERRKWF